jgi:hypothetical protein
LHYQLQFRLTECNSAKGISSKSAILIGFCSRLDGTQNASTAESPERQFYSHTMRLQISILLLCALGGSKCSSYKINSNDLIAEFNENRQDLSDLLKILKRDRLTYESGILLSKDTFNSVITKKFEKLGLTKVWVFTWHCFEDSQFDFTTNWGNKSSIHLYYNTCDSVETVKGFYRKDKNANEIWGMGNNWTIWSERKLVRGKK